MAITYWKTQQKSLKPEEVDANFEELDLRIKALEERRGVSLENPLASISLKGRSLCFEGIDGVNFNPVDLPLIMWKPCGLWKENTAYESYDIVQYGLTLYLCHQSHLSEKAFQKEHWNAIFSLDKVILFPPSPQPQKGEIALMSFKEEEKPAFFNGKEWFLLLTKAQPEGQPERSLH